MDDMAEIWSSLPEKEKKRRVMRTYYVLRRRSNQLKEVLSERDKTFPRLGIRQHFLFTLVRDCLSDIDFFFSLGKNKWKVKSYYPARGILETAAKIGYWTQQSRKEQDKLARMEVLIWIKKAHMRSKMLNDAKGVEHAEEQYESLMEDADPPITEKFKRLKKKSFPSVEQRLKHGGFEQPEHLYSFYRTASGSIHANLGELMVQPDDVHSFQRNALIVISIYIWLIKAVDRHLYEAIQSETELVIEESNRIGREGRTH